MALYDDKRFILSHIRHSFITCDDTGMCETVMMQDTSARYPKECLIHHPFNYDSDEEFDWYDYIRQQQSNIAGEDGKNAGFDELEENSINLDDDPDRTPVVTPMKTSPFQKLKLKPKRNAFPSKEDCQLFTDTDPVLKSELADDQPSQSFDIMTDSYDMMGTRRRSNTAQRLEKLRKERKFQSKTKVITWKSPTKIVEIFDSKTNRTSFKRVVLNPSTLTSEEIDMLEYDPIENVYYETEEYRRYLFPTNPETSSIPQASRDQNDISTETINSKPKSVLTLQIERSPNAPINPFNGFTRFDGRVSEGNSHTKRIRIFFYVNKEDDEFQKSDFTKHIPGLMHSGITAGPNWIEIVVLSSARVSDLIGLICWHYTHLQIEPPLKPDPLLYALKIAEENGDVDNDFPSLTATDDIKRYGFPYLALVEIETNIVVTIFIESEEVFSQIIVNSLTMTLQEIVEQIKKKRPHLFRPLPTDDMDSYLQLELQSQPGVSLDLDSKIGEYLEPASRLTIQANNQQQQNVTFILKFINLPNLNQISISGGIDFPSRGSVKFLEPFDDPTGIEGGNGDSNLSKSFNNKASNQLLKSDNIPTLRANRHSSIALFHLDEQSKSLPRKDSSISNSLSLTSGSASSTTTFTRKIRDPKDWSQNMLDMMEAPLYQCFEVMAVHKLINSPVELGISGTKVEITPKLSHSKSPSGYGGGFTEKLFSRFNSTKAVNIDVEDVVHCEPISRAKIEGMGRQQFKLVYYNGSSFKSMKFEGYVTTVDDILFKLTNVMKMRTSLRRKEYQSMKSRKKAISSKIYFKPKLMIPSSGSSSSSEDESTELDSSPSHIGTGGGDDSSFTDTGDGLSYYTSMTSQTTGTNRQKKDGSSSNRFGKFKS